jgi:hypothetical protein
MLQAVVSSGKVKPKKRNLITSNFTVSEVNQNVVCIQLASYSSSGAELFTDWRKSKG